MKNYGLKISKDGYDVDTTTQDNLVFGSNFFTNKILMEGELEIAVDNEVAPGWWTGTGTIVHGLNYNPIFLCYAKLGSVATSQGKTLLNGAGIEPTLSPRNGFGENIGKLLIDVTHTSQITARVKYYIFYDEGNL